MTGGRGGTCAAVGAIPATWQGLPSLPRRPTGSRELLPQTPHLHRRRGVQWEQQRLSFPGPQDSGSEQSSRSQWGTPAWCRTDQILRVPEVLGHSGLQPLGGSPPPGACPPWEVALPQARSPVPASHKPSLTPHLQVMQLISPKGGTEGCQLWLSGNHCPAKRQPRGPSACMGSPSWGWAPDPTVGRERRREGGRGQ